MPSQARFNLVLPQWLKDEANKKANEQNISLAEYIKDLIKKDIHSPHK